MVAVVLLGTFSEPAGSLQASPCRLEPGQQPLLWSQHIYFLTESNPESTVFVAMGSKS